MWIINTSSDSFLRLPNEGEITLEDDETSASCISFGFLSSSEDESTSLFNSTRSCRFWPNTKPLANEISSGFWVLLLLITAPNTAGGDWTGMFFLVCVSSTSVLFSSEEFNNFAIKRAYH